MRLVPFLPEHIGAFEAQSAQRDLIKWTTPDIAAMCAGSFSLTGLDDEGCMIGCAGLAPQHDYLVAWAVFSPLLFAHAVSVTRAVRRGLDLHRGRRILAFVEESHVNAARFAERLNFTLLETRADIHPGGALMRVYLRDV